MSETFSTIRKFHPFVLLFAFGSIYLITHNLNSDIPLYEKLAFLFVAFVLMNVMISVFISQMELGQKMLALVSSGFFYVVAVFYEVSRIQKEENLREKV